MFVGKNHLDYFEDLERLKFKIDYYLHNKNSLEIIRNNGNEIVKDNFTFKHQVQNIIKLANEN